MSRRAKSGIFSDPYASKTPNEGYGTVFPSCLTDEKFKQLPCTVKYFYTCCRAQARSEEGKRCLYMYDKENNKEYTPNIFFLFPAQQEENYGFDPSNASRYMRQLVDAGFIRVVERNKYRRKPNVYAFSAEWKK